jgi:hypothetical protein
MEITITPATKQALLETLNTAIANYKQSKTDSTPTHIRAFEHGIMWGTFKTLSLAGMLTPAEHEYYLNQI